VKTLVQSSRLSFTLFAFVLWMSTADQPASAQSVRLLSLQQNGLLTWTNSDSGGNCRIEWVPTVDGPWSSSWQSLTNIPGTNQLLSRPIPMLYRVVWTAPLITNIPPVTALGLITNRLNDTNFTILDVRTAGEYSVRHVTNSVNLDFYSSGFTAALAKLDIWRAYLVYCASGGRSSQAVAQMRTMGFMEVYNLTGGFPGLAQLPAAAPWLEP